MPNRYLQQELGLDPMTAEEAQRPPPQFPITPGAWGGQLREDMRREFLPAPGDTEDQQAFKAAKMFMLMMPGGKAPGGSLGALAGRRGAEATGGEVFRKFNEGEKAAVGGVGELGLWKDFGYALGKEGGGRWELQHPVVDPKITETLQRVMDMRPAGTPREFEFPLGAVLSDEILAAYPHMNISSGVLRRRSFPASRGGAASSWASGMETVGGGRASPGNMLASIFEHEIGGHMIQSAEGFPRGANKGSVQNYLTADPPLSPYQGLSKEVLSNMVRVLRERYGYSTKDIKEHFSPAFARYMRSAGETEARNAELRGLVPELRALPPRWTEDIPREYQIINYRSDTSSNPLRETGRDLLARNELGQRKVGKEWYPGPTFTKYLEEYKAQYGEEEYLKLLQRMMRGG